MTKPSLPPVLFFLLVLLDSAPGFAACEYGVRASSDGPQAAVSLDGSVLYCRKVPELSGDSQDTFHCVQGGRFSGTLVAPILKKGWFSNSYGLARFTGERGGAASCLPNG